MKLNALKAEQIKNGEIPIEEAYKLYGKDAVDSAVAELKKSDEEILAKYSADKMKSAIFGKSRPQNYYKKSRFIFSYSVVAKVAGLAAVLFIALGISITQFSTKSKISELPINQDFSEIKTFSQNTETRAKGAVAGEIMLDEAVESQFQLVLYKKTDDGAVVLKSGDKAEEGDFIQISYYSGSNKYGIIFSVDGNKNVTKHFPENTWTASPLRNESDLLDFSYELDDAPEFEDFIFLASENKFTISEKEAYKVFAEKNYLEEKFGGVYKIEVLLNK